jgi:uncharacterized membrane protein YeaQ/YmgE (transglycosylase-associated protein family)
MLSLLIQLLSGAAGGNLAGAVFKNLNLGTLGNSIAGIVGGGLGGQLLQYLSGAGATTGGLDFQSILSSVAGGGLGGTIVMAIVGWIKGAQKAG